MRQFKGVNLKILVEQITPPFSRLDPRVFARTSAIFLYFFALNYFFRTFHFASGYGWLDPWVQVGYGQAFPETAYVHHYYKESRILSITFEALILQFSPYAVNFFWGITAALTALYVYRISRSASNHPIVGLILGSVVALSPILWGDWAGGGDYYNTFGNLVSVVTAFTVFKMTKYLSAETPVKNLFRMVFISGILFAMVLFETPSGIIILLPLELVLLSNILLSSGIDLGRRRHKAQKIINFQIRGFISLVFFEVIYLIVLSESPIRLLAGPKFLFESIVDSSIQNEWAQNLQLSQFLESPNLFLFTCIFAVQFAYLLQILMHKSSRKGGREHLLNSSIPILFYFLLIGLQFAEKTIVFTTSYFLTPVLIVGICFVANIQLALPKKTLLIPAVLFALSTAQILPTPRTLLVLIILLFLFLIFEKFKNFEKRSMFKYGFANTFFVMIFLVAMLPQISFTNPQNFQICESERIVSRAKVIEIAKVLDSLGFKRGTLAMGADLDLLRLTLDSKCSDFENKSLGGILIAVAETGFPAASSFGSVLVDSDIDQSDFAEDNLALIASREVVPTGCFIEWEKLRETSRVKVEFMNHVFGARLTCVDSTSLE